jgi:hypothetical protein
MTLYSIFEKENVQQASALGPVAVPERFSWFAAILPPVYALRYGLILALLFWIAFGFEAPALRRDALTARGWIWQGDIIANGEDIAERDYLSLRR